MKKEKSSIFETRLADASKLREAGNELFKAGDLAAAERRYRRALHHVDMDELQVQFGLTDAHRAALFAVKVPVLLNICQCALRSAAPGGAAEVIELATAAIAMDAGSAKAYFWRAKARMAAAGGGDIARAQEDMARAAELAPGDRGVRAGLQALRMRAREQERRSRRMWSGLFERARGGARQLGAAAAGGGGKGDGGLGVRGAAQGVRFLHRATMAFFVGTVALAVLGAVFVYRKGVLFPHQQEL
ncbi:hypothetical protein JKP88DRAFT_351884 [Tribonema minus]|uniref:Uncharacterized protein n=1 Tax=Tribonema minus TaxID=303371 RepID=A0A835ZHU6_9STRA|nr:hypothetical protein JKP88DRAFT_351884 [Tribonema minus]